jgi:ParB family chromosome partitioning protein
MNEKRKALGRGLDSLIPAARTVPPPAPPAVGTITAAVSIPPPAHGIRELSLEVIDRNPYQTRGHVDEAALEELAASIKATGVLQPIVVRPTVDHRYQLIAGERRWLASQKAGKTTIPVVIKHVSNEQAMEMTIVENLQREDLNPMEQARAFARLSREFGLTQEQMAERTGKDRSSVANFMRLLKLPEPVQHMVEQGNISLGHAKALMGLLDSPEALATLAQRVSALALNVRQTEQAVQNLVHPPEKVEKAARVVDPNVREAERELERVLGCRITIHDRRGKGTILIEYSSIEDFDRVLDALGNKRATLQ